MNEIQATCVHEIICALNPKEVMNAFRVPLGEAVYPRVFLATPDFVVLQEEGRCRIHTTVRITGRKIEYAEVLPPLTYEKTDGYVLHLTLRPLPKKEEG